ncbi:MAG TPA: LysR substrate-binding domain-containing protein [Acetobacteraceae bacterium]|jgi:DNA-binding transcriptional LysR family regulator|nr:LysR substrate-binding domain-containing protein [Acetobacteraceae bacterium]
MNMTLPQGLDTDLLRAFVLIAEGHSFTQAAVRVGRTQSAISMQVKRLEEVLGQPVLSRSKGGSVDLTPHGHYLLARARQILALNDEVLTTFRAPQIAGRVRLGSPDDYAFAYLPQILKRFAETHPAVQVDVQCSPSGELMHRIKAGELDLTLISNGHSPSEWPSVPLWRGPLVWITSTRFAPHRQDPLPLALADRRPFLARGSDCEWAGAATRALEQAGRQYRIAYTSASQVGTHAPVLAGLAVTVSTLSWLPDGLRAMRAEEGLPRLPDFEILLMKAKRPLQPVTDALAAHIQESFVLDSGQSAAAA